ncbi:hypothetical protein QJS10_CPA03g01531 [Acorus calamus]|uniref:Uncharacterized protein n=1 Tax=Acorus calamus TaxID=4465 RepID=A0AAV9F6U5_ACOCL|nr:hypothetical protein QJS10_CPA03g01531 [Acorus calamus]
MKEEKTMKVRKEGISQSNSPGSGFHNVGKLGYISGFGYDVCMGNYKILKIHPEHGAGKWRDIQWVDQHLQNAQKDFSQLQEMVRRVAKVHLQCKGGQMAASLDRLGPSSESGSAPTPHRAGPKFWG